MGRVIAFVSNGVRASYAILIVLVFIVCTILKFTQYRSINFTFRLSDIVSTNISSILLLNIQGLFCRNLRDYMLYIMHGKATCTWTCTDATRNMVSIEAECSDRLELISQRCLRSICS
jgi:hypothetical protein